jgi:alpha-galactosidase
MVNTTIALTAEGVSLWMVARDACLPEIVHWGAALPQSTADVAAAVLALEPPASDGGMDVPVRITVLPESGTGFFGRPGLEGQRDGRDWSPRWRTDSITVDGEELGAAYEGGPGAVVVTAHDDRTQLGLTLEIELLPSGLVRTRAEITNLGDEPYALTAVTPRLPVPPRANELLDFAGHWGTERSPQRLPFAVGAHVREGRRGRTGFEAATVLHAGEHGFGFRGGDVWGVHVAWSGNHVHIAERLATGRWLGGGELLLPGEVILSGGASYTSPWLFGSYGHGLDDLSRRFHAYLRAREGYPSSPRPVTLNSWEAAYFNHDVDELLRLVDLGAQVGAERFVLDDGWFGSRRDDTRGLGDWFVSPEVYPRGLHPLVDRVRSHGMQFGLWVEPEMVNLDSDVARAHPDWVIQVPGRLPPPERQQFVLDLTNPDCFDYLRTSLVALLDEYEIGYFKWDHNRDLVDGGSPLHEGRPAVHEQTLAVYRLMRELKDHQPGLEIESCSSGGARADLGIMEICDRIWVSDDTDAGERLRIQRWTMSLLPPELLGCHIGSSPSHQTGRQYSVAFRASTALIGHLGVEWDLRALSDEQLAELKGWIALYKGIRPLVQTGVVVRGDEEGLWLTGVVSQDRNRAVYVVSTTTVSRMELTFGRIRLAGLDPSKRYAVRPVVVDGPSAMPSFKAPWFGEAQGTEFVGAQASGAWLGTEGLALPAMWPDSPIVLLVRTV